MAMLRRSGDSRVISRPATRIAPARTGTKPEIARSNVVLPQPDEPSKATNSPAATSRQTPFRTLTGP